MQATNPEIGCKQCNIHSTSIFRHLNTEETEKLNQEKSCFSYKRGYLLYEQQSRVTGIYCINKGILKVFKTGVDGREQIIRFAKPGDLIAFRSVLSGELACTSAKALEDCEVCFIPSESLIHLIKNNGLFALDMLQMACRELGESNSYITDIAQKTVRERLSEVLLQLHETFGTDKENNLNISLTREELANIVGTATESVIRLLSEFKSDKIIELNGRKIKIINLRTLTRMANII